MFIRCLPHELVFTTVILPQSLDVAACTPDVATEHPVASLTMQNESF